jgi:hypothetical protein
VSKGHDENPAGRDERGYNGHGDAPFVLIEVHPYGRDHDEAEFVLSRCDAFQLWESIVYPLDERRRVVPEAVFPERCGWLDSHHRMAFLREPRGVRSGPGTDIHRLGRRVRNQVKHGLVLVHEWKGIVSFDELRRVFRIAPGSANHDSRGLRQLQLTLWPINAGTFSSVSTRPGRKSREVIVAHQAKLDRTRGGRAATSSAPPGTTRRSNGSAPTDILQPVQDVPYWTENSALTLRESNVATKHAHTRMTGMVKGLSGVASTVVGTPVGDT